MQYDATAGNSMFNEPRCGWDGVKFICSFIHAKCCQVSYLTAGQVKTARGVLPEDDPRRTSAVLQRAVAATEAEDLAAAAASLRSVIEDEEDLLTQAWSQPAPYYHIRDFAFLSSTAVATCRRCADIPCPLLLQTVSSFPHHPFDSMKLDLARNVGSSWSLVSCTHGRCLGPGLLPGPDVGGAACKAGGGLPLVRGSSQPGMPAARQADPGSAPGARSSALPSCERRSSRQAGGVGLDGSSFGNADVWKPLLQDSLQQTGSLVRAVLPEGHIIASRMEKLVEANRSAQTKSRLKQQEERLQVHCLTTISLPSAWRMQ